MSVSSRNILTATYRAADPFEAQAPPSANGFGTFQPFGAQIGKQVGVPYSWLFEPYHWKLTIVEAGAGETTVQVASATATLPELVVITTDAANGDGANLQSAVATDFENLTTYAVWLPFVAKAGYDIHCRVRVLMDEATSVGFLAGLTVSDTTLLANGVYATTDLIGFYKATAGTSMKGVVRTSSTSTETTIGTVAANTWMDMEFLLSARSAISYWFNGAKATNTTMTNLPADTVPLTLSIAYQTMNTAAQICKVQCCMAYQESI